jgi:hypothetical protein
MRGAWVERGVRKRGKKKGPAMVREEREEGKKKKKKKVSSNAMSIIL